MWQRVTSGTTSSRTKRSRLSDPMRFRFFVLIASNGVPMAIDHFTSDRYPVSEQPVVLSTELLDVGFDCRLRSGVPVDNLHSHHVEVEAVEYELDEQFGPPAGVPVAPELSVENDTQSRKSPLPVLVHSSESSDRPPFVFDDFGRTAYLAPSPSSHCSSAWTTKSNVSLRVR